MGARKAVDLDLAETVKELQRRVTSVESLLRQELDASRRMSAGLVHSDREKSNALAAAHDAYSAASMRADYAESVSDKLQSVVQKLGAELEDLKRHVVALEDGRGPQPAAPF